MLFWETDVLAIDGISDLAVDPLHAECSKHALSSIGPSLQVYHEHLHTFIKHTYVYVDVSVF